MQGTWDWLHREIVTEIDNKRNIIPLMMDGFDFGSPATVKALTGKLDGLNKYNSIGIPAEYFDDAMAKLRNERFLNKPLESISHPVSSLTRAITEEQKGFANEASLVNFEKLPAQEWFESGYVSTNVDEQISFYTEALKLEPENADAYNNRAIAYGEKGDFNAAYSDFDKAIQMDAKEHAYYRNKANLLRENGYFWEGFVVFLRSKFK